MSIRKSAGADVESLIAELLAHPADEPRREAALARLAVIGQRAIVRLLAALKSAAAADARIALLAALERIPDSRSVEAVLGVLGPEYEAGTALRVAAVRAARPLLALVPQGTAVLERLTVLALDPAEPLPARRAALDALGDLPPRTLAPIRRRLLDDPDPAVRALAEPAPALADADADAARLPEDPGAALDLVGRLGGEAPLPVLHALIAPARAREAEGGRRRREWSAVRGAIHVALARRDSRVGLYDLREALESEALHPLPPDFLAAARLIGDASCLEPLARAWLQAAPSQVRGTDTWAQDLRQAFRELMARERPAVRRRHVQRMEQRWGDGVKELVTRSEK